MKRFFAMLLCLTMVMACMAPISLAEEEFSMLAVEEVYDEEGPVDIVLPEEDELPADVWPADELEEIE